MKKIFLLFSLLIGSFCSAQTHSLVGYWQNWQDGQSPYIQLNQIDTTYNIIEVSFAMPTAGTTYNMAFTPEVLSPAAFTSQVDELKARGKKVVISIGGANAHVVLNNVTEMNTFVSTMTSIINTYHFDGIDIDLEGSVSITGGTISNPRDSLIVNLIKGIKQLMTNHRANHHKKMFLTFAPETAYVQGGMSGFGGINGAYLPVLHALRDSTDILQVQLYNSGTMYGIDGQIYAQGTSDFIVAMTEAVIHGFNTWGGVGGMFTGFRADQVAVGLPSCTSAAGGGFVHPDTVKAAVNYLMGRGPKPGRYTRVNSYPTLRGLMTWSINWDATTTCHATRYEFAKNYARIFILGANSIGENNSEIKDFRLSQNYPNPFNPSTVINFEVNKPAMVNITVFDILGHEISTIVNNRYTPGSYSVDFSGENLSAGVYYYSLTSGDFKDTKKMMIVK